MPVHFYIIGLIISLGLLIMAFITLVLKIVNDKKLDKDNLQKTIDSIRSKTATEILTLRKEVYKELVLQKTCDIQYKGLVKTYDEWKEQNRLEHSKIESAVVNGFESIRKDLRGNVNK